MAEPRPAFGVIIVGDEILSGKRADKHLPKVIELLGARGLPLDFAEYVGDDPDRITATLRRAFAARQIVFSCGGIGATPDDHTRACAARALGVPLALHPEARRLILERAADVAREQSQPFDPQAPEQVHRLNMGCFPAGAEIVPNPYNKIPGFRCEGPGGGWVGFVPGFPVMAWPMIEQLLDQHCTPWFAKGTHVERSVIVQGAMEAALTPLMLQIEAAFPGVRVFSLPSVDHPVHGRHIELGVKGSPEGTDRAYAQLLQGLNSFGAQLGPEMVR